MGSSSSDNYDPPAATSTPSTGLTPVAQQAPPGTWMRYPSFLPSDPTAMATGLTPQMASAIDRYAPEAYMTPTEVEGGTQVRAVPTTPTAPTAAPAAPTPAAPVGITRAELGNKPTGQMLALVGTDDRARLADLMRRQRWREEH